MMKRLSENTDIKQRPTKSRTSKVPKAATNSMASKTKTKRKKGKQPPSLWYISKAASANATLSTWAESDKRGGLSPPSAQRLPRPRPRYLPVPVRLLPPTAAILKRPARQAKDIRTRPGGRSDDGLLPPPRPVPPVTQRREVPEREAHSNWRGRWRRLWRVRSKAAVRNAARRSRRNSTRASIA